MARIKYFNKETNQWEYADIAIGGKGDTPVKGVDYFTDNDKAEMIQSVLAQLPTYNGGVS